MINAGSCQGKIHLFLISSSQICYTNVFTNSFRSNDNCWNFEHVNNCKLYDVNQNYKPVTKWEHPKLLTFITLKLFPQCGILKNCQIQSNLYIKTTRASKPVYKDHSREPANKCGLYEQLPFIYRFEIYALFINGKTERLPFIDSDLLYRGALYRQRFVI
jgi:hypothetical protein